MPFNNNFQKFNQLLTDTYVGLTIEIWDKLLLNLTKTKNKIKRYYFNSPPSNFTLKICKNDKCIKVKSDEG